jgi:hypothetical protein
MHRVSRTLMKPYLTLPQSTTLAIQMFLQGFHKIFKGQLAVTLWVPALVVQSADTQLRKLISQIKVSSLQKLNLIRCR